MFARYSIRLLTHQPRRLALVVGGIALCIVLMLFLLSVHQGVADGSVDYVRKNKTDLWVLQGNATNILRGSSILSSGHGILLREIPGVESAAPVFFLLATIRKGQQTSTVYLTGYDIRAGVGGPPELLAGRHVQDDREIVLDRSFAAKFHFGIGDDVSLQDDTLRVVGLSTGTNMFVIQYAFASLQQVQSLVGYPGLVTCYLVKLQNRENLRNMKELIRLELPGLAVYDHDEFLENNIREMEAGILPLLITIAGIGAIVLTTILSLILTITILERRRDFAILKILGSPRHFLSIAILSQGLHLTTAGVCVAFAVFFPVTWLIEQLAPEVCTQTSLGDGVIVVCAAWVMGLFSSSLALRRVRNIYPLEAFE